MKIKVLGIGVLLVILSSCYSGRESSGDSKLNQFQSVANDHHYDKNLCVVSIKTIDSCEYIVWEGSHGEVGFTHKGNCSWCRLRLK